MCVCHREWVRLLQNDKVTSRTSPKGKTASMFLEWAIKTSVLSFLGRLDRVCPYGTQMEPHVYLKRQYMSTQSTKRTRDMLGSIFVFLNDFSCGGPT